MTEQTDLYNKVRTWDSKLPETENIICHICGSGDNINWVKEPSADGDNDDRHSSYCGECHQIVCSGVRKDYR